MLQHAERGASAFQTRPRRPREAGGWPSDEAAIAEHKKKLSAAMKQLAANCKDCHVKYRD